MFKSVSGCIEGIPGHYGMFGGIMGCSRGVPGLFRAVPGCSGGVPGVFRGVPGCSGVFRVCSGCVPGFTDTRRDALIGRFEWTRVLQIPLVWNLAPIMLRKLLLRLFLHRSC